MIKVSDSTKSPVRNYVIGQGLKQVRTGIAPFSSKWEAVFLKCIEKVWELPLTSIRPAPLQGGVAYLSDNEWQYIIFGHI